MATSDDDGASTWASLTEEEREELRKAMKERVRGKAAKPRVTRIVGSLLGSMLPEGLLDLSKIGDGAREQEFKEGFAEGRLARDLGDLLTAARKPKKEDET